MVQKYRHFDVVERYRGDPIGVEDQTGAEEPSPEDPISPEEAKSAYHLGESEVAGELLLAEHFKQIVESIENSDTRDTSPSRPDWIQSILAALATPQYAALTSFLLLGSLVFSGLLYQENQRIESEGLMFMRVALNRSPELASEIRPGVAGEPIFLMLELPSDAATGFSSYRVTLNRLTVGVPEEIAEIEVAEPTFRNELAVTVAGQLITEGRYEAVIVGRAVDSPSGRYQGITTLPFRAVAE